MPEICKNWEARCALEHVIAACSEQFQTAAHALIALPLGSLDLVELRNFASLGYWNFLYIYDEVACRRLSLERERLRFFNSFSF